MKINKLNSEEISFICSQFAVILRTGVALHDGVEVLLEDIDSEFGKKVLKDISDTLNNEKPLYIALDNSKVFPDYVVKMVKIGELTGRLDEVLDNLSEYYEAETQIKRSIHDAILQPMIILAMMFVIICALVVKIIPVFEDIFRQLDPLLSERVSDSVRLSSTIGVVAIIIIGLVFILVLFLYLMSNVLRNNSKIEKMLSRVPFISKILDEYALTRFVNAMYMMIRSGVDTTTSIEYAIELNQNEKMALKLNDCYKRLQQYESFADVIVQSGIFKGIHKQMIKLAYKSGTYEQAWEKINKKYNDELEDSLVKMIALIEPVLVAVISIIIGVILIAVMLPLISVMGNL